MTPDEIRKWASKAYTDVNITGSDVIRVQDTQMGQMLMLAEIAAQLAEANALTRFEMGLDDENPGT